MNATQLLQHMTPAVSLVRRVRIKNDPRVVGTVFDADDAGWIYWVGDDRSCHVSRADYLEACS